MAEFKEFFKLRDKLRESINEQRRFLVNEMSLRYEDSSAQVLNDIKSNKIRYQFIIENGEFIENFKVRGAVYKVYRYVGSAEFNVAFLTEDFVAALVEFNEQSNSCIKIAYICEMRIYRGLMTDIFTKFLLNYYEEIESDNLHTVEAYNFYYRLAFDQNHGGNFRMYLRTSKGDTPITNSEQMKNTFGKDDKLFDNVYVLKKI